jgi:hypothetical protein
MTEGVRSVHCSACDTELPDSHAGKCPECGDSRKTVKMELSVTQRPKASLHWKHTHEYIKRHKVLAPATLILTIAAPFLGLWLSGVTGVYVGLAVSLILFLLAAYAVTVVREIHEGGEP